MKGKDNISTTNDGIQLLSFNLWNLNKPLGDRMRHLDTFLLDHKHDIVVFQEVSPLTGGDLQTEQLRSLSGFHCCYQATGEWQGRSEGLAVYSRLPISFVRCDRLPGSPSDMDRGVLHAAVKVGENVLHVFNTHLAFRVEDGELRESQALHVASRVAALQRQDSDAPVILCGDFNDVPASRTLDALLSGGLRNAFTGESSVDYTFSSDNRYVNPELLPDRRIDHVLVSSSVEVEASEIVLCDSHSLASDHYGLSVKVRL